MKSCTPLCGRAHSRFAISTGFLPVFAALTFVALFAFPNLAQAQFATVTGAGNPLNTLDAGSRSVPVFVDIDNDCDKDLFVGNSDGEIKYYKNTGSASAPVFVEQMGTANPLGGFNVGNNAKPAFADLDDDGDLDCFVGALDGLIYTFENTGTVSAPNFSARTGPATAGLNGNPFDLEDVGANSSPVFLDFDNDGDYDCFVGRSQSTNSIRYFRNEGDNMNPVYNELTGASNPLSNSLLSVGGNGDITSNVVLTPVNLDADGDIDIYVGVASGVFRYFRNNGNSFTHVASGSGPLDAGGTKDVSASATDYSAPTFVDIDADGDLDCFSGRNNGMFVFYRNNAPATAPVITCNPYRVNLSSAGSATVDPATLNAATVSSFLNTTTFPCPANLTLSVTGTLQTFGCVDADNTVSPLTDGMQDGTTLTLTATDGVTSTTCAVVIYVQDVTPPVANTTPLPALTRDICNYDPSTGLFTTSIPLPTATDACPPGSADAVRVRVNSGPELTATVATDWDAMSNPDFVVGVYTLTWIYQDARGNTSTQTQTLNVVSNAPPTWNNCPANLTLSINTSSPPNPCGYDGTLPPGAVWTPAPNPIDCDPPLSGWVITNNYSPTGFFPVGVTNVSYSAQDAAGNVGYCNFTVTVTDGTPPTIAGLTDPNYSYGTVPTTGTVSCASGTITGVPADAGQCGAVVNWTGPTYTATDNCGGTVNVTIVNQLSVPVSPTGTLFPIGTTTVNYRASDAGGTSTTFCSFTITVVDTQNPTITCPGNLTVPTAPNLCTSALINLTLPTASDNCMTGLTVLETDNLYTTPASPQPPRSMTLPLGGTTFYFVATDASANSATCTFTITVTDQQAPSFGVTCPSNQTFVANAMGNCSYAYTWTLPTATDNCGSPTVPLPPTFTPLAATVPPTGTTNNSGTFNEGTTRVTYTATDAALNSATCSFTVTVTNTTPPSISCPVIQPVVVSAGPSTTCTYTLAAIAGVSSTATAPCDPGVISYRNSAGALQTVGTSTFPLGLHTLTAIATDVSGNTSTCSVTINVLDNLGPQLSLSTCPPNITVNSDATAACGANVTWNSPVWVDNCSTTIYYNRTTTPVGPTPATATLLSNNGGGFFPVGTTTVNIVAKDGPSVSSNLGTPCGFSVTVLDDDRPSITNCPASPITLSTTYPSCNAMYTLLAPTVTDNGCATTTIVAYTISAPSAASGIYPLVTPPDVTLSQGNNTITYTVTDAAANSTSCVVVVQVRDQQGPVISCASLPQIVVTASCTGVPTAWADAALGAVDCTTPVTVNAPTVLSTTGGTTPVLSGTPAARTGTFPVGVTTLQYVALDNASPANSSTCTFTIDVRENTPPIINCPVGTQNFAATTGCSATITSAMLTPPSVSDNCPATPTLVLLSPSFPQTLSTTSGSVSVTWRATDASGNSATCSRNIAVTDQTPPVIACGADITVNTASCSGISSSSVVLPVVNASDNCTPPSPVVTLLTSVPPTYPMGATVLTYQATDGAALIATCTKQVIVRDNQPPVIVCPSNLTIANPTSCPASVPISPQSITDNCVAVNYVSSHPTALFVCGTTTTVTLTATDFGGNTSTCAVMVTVNDPTAVVCTPTLGALTVSASQTVNLADISGLVFTPSGCCTSPTLSSVVLTGGPVAGGPYPATVLTPNAYTFTATGTYTVSYTINCSSFKGGNESENNPMTFTRTVNVTSGSCLPTNATFAGCTGASTLNAGCAATLAVTPASVGLSATDNCTNAVSINPSSITLNATGTAQNVTFSVTVGGNTVTCVKSVTVNGSNTPPTVSNCPANITMNIVSSGCTLPVPWTEPTAVDPCGGGVSTTRTGPAPGSVFSAGTLTTITYTFAKTLMPSVTSTCSFTVTVNDQMPPVINCPGDITVLNDMGDCGPSGSGIAHNVVLGTPTVSDNCGTPTFSSDAPIMDGYELFANTVTWTAVDDSGNSADCQQIVYVEPRAELCNGLDDDCDGMVDEDVAGGLSELVKKLATDGASGDTYGHSVGISGNYAIVGAPLDDDRGTSSGAAYILSFDGTTWTQQKKIVPTDGAAGDLFGESVAIDGDLVIIGAREDDDRGTNSGSAYIYGRNVGGTNNWGLVKKLTDSNGAAYDRFGWSVDIHNGYAAVGAPQDDDLIPPSTTVGNKGSVSIFGQNTGGLNNWGQLQKRMATDGTFFDEFGNSVSLGSSGGRTYLLVGAPKDDEFGTNSNSGAAFIFRDDFGGANNWGQIKKLVPADRQIDDNFGFSVAISGEHAVVTANLEDSSGLTNNGSAYVFDQNLGGVENWGERAKLTASDAQDSDNFGWSVAIDGTGVIVGARNDDEGGVDGGSAYFFSQNEGGSNVWGEVGKVVASDGAANDNFGISVGISGGNSVVGAFRDDIGVQTDRGSAYFFANGCGGNFNGNSVDRSGNQASILAGASSLRLFPNPTSDVLNIDVTLETESELTITVTDAAGRIVSQVFSGVAAPEARYSWDASTVPAGLYFVRVDGISLRKVMPVSVVR